MVHLAKKKISSQVLMAHAYNPSFSEGKDQEDHSLKPAPLNSLQNPISKKTQHKKGLLEWFKVQALSLSPSTKKKNLFLLSYFQETWKLYLFQG
jgi:hypothetical protein